MKKLSVLMLLIIAFGAASCGEDRHESYATYRDVVAAGAGPRSWFPACIPDTAVDLENFHNLDSNETIGTFRVPASSPFTGCAQAANVDEPRLDPPLGHWPSCLKGRVTLDVIKQCGMAAYEDSRFVIAFSTRDGHAYYWSRRS